MVGQGGYSEVYKGDLRDGKAIAVKRLAKDNTDEAKEKEFLSELGIIGQVSHPNTASLVGYCIENGLYLIFEFSLNGNLASALHGQGSIEFYVKLSTFFIRLLSHGLQRFVCRCRKEGRGSCLASKVQDCDWSCERSALPSQALQASNYTSGHKGIEYTSRPRLRAAGYFSKNGNRIPFLKERLLLSL